MAVSKLSAKQPWTAVWTPGVNLVNFYNLYDSKGDVTISVATSIPTTLDGPIQVVRYGALTVNAPMTAAQRCRGFMPICDALNVGAAGSISMTARGAAGTKNWAVDKDIFVPQSITFTGKNTSYADFLKWIRTTGYCIFDPSLYACPPPGMGDVQCDWATWTPYGSTIISAAGCGAAQPARGGLGGSGTYYVGNTGNAGSGGGTGGGGQGSYLYSGGGAGMHFGRSGPGRPWGGGVGACGCYENTPPTVDADIYGGIGGHAYSPGAGNPAGNGTASGTGGVLIVICRGNATINTGGSLVAGGVSCPYVSLYNGGSSGGGSVALFFLGTLSNSGTISAPGGAAVNYGGAGGLGSTQSKSFATMGWAA